MSNDRTSIEDFVEMKMRIIKHLPYDGDIETIILKGHLLIEEVLNVLLRSVSVNSSAMSAANLSFYKLASVAKAIFYEDRMSMIWEAIFEINSLRNALAHKLEIPDWNQRLEKFALVASEGADDAKQLMLENPERQMTGCIEFICGALVGIAMTDPKVIPSRVLT